MREQYLRGSLTPSASLLELLHKHLPNDDIIIVGKHSGKDDCDTILLSRHIPTEQRIDTNNIIFCSKMIFFLRVSLLVIPW